VNRKLSSNVAVTGWFWRSFTSTVECLWKNCTFVFDIYASVKRKQTHQSGRRHTMKCAVFMAIASFLLSTCIKPTQCQSCHKSGGLRDIIRECGPAKNSPCASVAPLYIDWELIQANVNDGDLSTTFGSLEKRGAGRIFLWKQMCRRQDLWTKMRRKPDVGTEG